MFDVVFGVAYCVIFVADYVQLASQHQPVQLYWGHRADGDCVQQRILHTQEYISFYYIYIIYYIFLASPPGSTAGTISAPSAGSRTPATPMTSTY